MTTTDLSTSTAYVNTYEVPRWMWLGFDWAQAELYLLALFSQDDALRRALYSSDVHKAVISMMYAIPVDAVTELQRDLAKVLSYALIYSGFDIDSTVSNVLKKAKDPNLTREDVVAALDKYIEIFHALYTWTGRALLDWYDTGGYVAYLLGQRRMIIFPDYLKREDSKLRRSTEGRTAINAYGQNSVGLLLKMYMAKIYTTPFLRQNTTQHLPLFDAHTCLVRSEHAVEVQRQLHNLATPLLRHNGWEIRMKADWKASLVSWGDMAKVPAPAPSDDPWVIEWNAAPLNPMPAIDLAREPSVNPFATLGAETPAPTSFNPFAARAE